jgi:hypothetical protein
MFFFGKLMPAQKEWGKNNFVWSPLNVDRKTRPIWVLPTIGSYPVFNTSTKSCYPRDRDIGRNDRKNHRKKVLSEVIIAFKF